jgi:hypothetical protein
VTAHATEGIARSLAPARHFTPGRGGVLALRCGATFSSCMLRGLALESFAWHRVNAHFSMHIAQCHLRSVRCMPRCAWRDAAVYAVRVASL